MAAVIDDLGLLPIELTGPNRRAAVVAVTTDTDYAAGGYALVAADFGFATLELVDIGPTAGFVPQYNYATGKLMVLYADYDAVADGALIEVANGLNGIDGVVFRGLVVGTVA